MELGRSTSPSTTIDGPIEACAPPRSPTALLPALRRRRSTAPLKPIEQSDIDTVCADSPSTTIDGPIEAMLSTHAHQRHMRSLRRRRSTAPLKHLLDRDGL